MPLQNAKYFKYAFAQNGDINQIPDQSNNKINYYTGFPINYEQNPEQGGEYIYRRDMNGLLNHITQAIKTLQLNGANVWNAEIAADTGYPAGAVVWAIISADGTSIVNTDSFAQNGYFFAPFCSMIDNNKDTITESTVNKTWWLVDGKRLFDVEITLCNKPNYGTKTKLGYLPLGSQDPSLKFSYTDYPRVKYAFDNNMMCEYFTDNGDNTFSIVDIRGYFPRVWNNGGTIDSNRNFETLQNDAIRNITGNLGNGGADAFGIFYPPACGGAFSSTNAYLRYPGISGGNDRGTLASFNASRVVPTATENRPYNFNVKMFIKI